MLNVVALIGRLVRDPEARRTQSGNTMATFTLAVQRDFVSKETGKREADFIDCVAFGKTGELVSKWFSKGRTIGVEGSITTRTYTDKAGNNRKAMEISVDKAHFVDSKAAESLDVEPPEPKKQTVAAPDGDFAMIEDSEDLPF